MGWWGCAGKAPVCGGPAAYSMGGAKFDGWMGRTPAYGEAIGGAAQPLTGTGPTGAKELGCIVDMAVRSTGVHGSLETKHR